MNDTIKFLTENSETLIAIVTGVVTVASLVANLTPSDKDNGWVAKVAKVVNYLALNFKKK
jgi:hypothetical protein